MTKRKVSVIVPTRDRPTFLRDALKSIRAVEGPDLEFEILVGDNGPSAATRSAAEEYGARYFEVERVGCPAARNAGMRNATGDYVAFLDDDDVWLPEHIRPHLALMESRPELGAVLGQVISTDQDLKPITDPWPIGLPESGDMFVPIINYFPQVGATVVRAEVLRRIGIFDETLIGDTDWDWQLRIARSYPIGFVQQPCVLFRQRPKGSFDKLTQKRIGYTRRIFFRNALPAWQKFASPRQFIRAYNNAMSPYFIYYATAAVARLESGDRAGTLRAAAQAFQIIPTSTLRHLLGSAPSPFRNAVKAALSPRPLGNGRSKGNGAA